MPELAPWRAHRPSCSHARMQLAFVLVESGPHPSPDSIVSAASKLGVDLTFTSFDGEGPMAFSLPGGEQVMYMRMPAPHPDAERMIGVFSPDSDELAKSKAHYVVMAPDGDGDLGARELDLAAYTAALVDACPDAIAAALGHGATFLHAKLFRDFAELGVSEGFLPAEIAISLTAAMEPDDRMSFLTHGMQRFGREELYVTAPMRGTGALDFTLGLMRWLYYERDKQLPTGDTVGRTEDERIVVQRVPSPLGEGPEVIRLDLPS